MAYLAYKLLNTAADVGSGEFPVSNYDSDMKWSQLTSAKYSDQPLPTVNLDPFFTELVNAGLTVNKFSFLTRRSITRYSSAPDQDPLNKGWFILGGGEEHTELYTCYLSVFGAAIINMGTIDSNKCRCISNV
jgi:hypothetical protein